jgi:hypothetical protein
VKPCSFSRASQEINQGLSDDSKSGELGLAKGMLSELTARGIEPNLQGTWSAPVGNGARERADGLLKDAAAEYERTLAGAPDLLEARLRLGWVHRPRAGPLRRPRRQCFQPRHNSLRPRSMRASKLSGSMYP